ncbi:ATP-dependent RecD-like DNA helicase, partial [Christensenellaceae bacterium OttesenSCG-928-L17]|nr:ATP-dependent RecD-like DNA helicase [Christensenellaceae bacterium OttesenSCG-928-L17]
QNGWTVLELVDDTGEEIAAVGILPTVAPGEHVELTGGYVEHPSYGRQFKAVDCKSVAPASLGALESYLASGLIKGVGEATARLIVQRFGMDTLSILENEPERLKEISGIGRVRAAGIAQSFFEQRAMRDMIMRLQAYGITVRQAMHFYTLYGPYCVERIEENPYRLVEEVEGIGFKTADKIARNMGIEHDSRMRLRAGVTYVLIWARQEGHTYLPRALLIETAVEMMAAPQASVEEALDTLILDNSLHYTMVDETDAVYLPVFYRMESDCARRLMELNTPSPLAYERDPGEELRSLERELNITLAPQQREAVLRALTTGVMVITGGPGTGKTTILQFVLRMIERLGLDFALCAPTGRAAKRMEEATGRDASTIHRLLEYGGEGRPHFARDEDNPLLFDMLIVDEMSMVDLPLFYALLRALPMGTRLVLVGDADQLPPVGPGTVLHDIIKSGVTEIVRLTEIYRQSERGGIARNAHKINAGMEPAANAYEDFRFLPCAIAGDAYACVQEICTGQSAFTAGYDPQRDVQVIAPMKKGPLGVKQLNAKLQASMNPPAAHKAQREFGETIFREGDKVMQIKNDYRIGWVRQVAGKPPELGEGAFNGDMGTVYKIDTREQMLAVLFDDERLAEYPFSQLDELDLAYCISIHKSQGSEFPVVVLPLLSGPPILMTRNLLYTAITRARAQVVVVGDWRTVLQMVENKRERKRYSALHVRLSACRQLFETEA